MPAEIRPTVLNRRSLIAGISATTSLALAGCTTSQPRLVQQLPNLRPEPPMGSAVAMYGPVVDQGYPIPAVPVEEIDPIYLRQIVRDPTGERPGTVVVDTSNHFLYLVRPGGEAMRYGVGLGREGFEWAGRAEIEWKQAWPRWFPPAPPPSPPAIR